tara:strand:- start:2920 stop:4365 length:1446 start_codon:yes stop_codon:yes gene_type:complete
MHEAAHFRLLGKIVLQITLGLSVVTLVVFGLDRIDAFDEADMNHNEQRWISLYELGESVDLLILGNSRSYTGINPKQLSAATGMTSFVLSNDGIIMKDAYWNLREALTVCTPQLILVETAMMNFLETKSDVPALLWNNIQAFDARMNHELKWESLLDLFTPEEAIYAVSKTIRNHHVILKNPERFSENISRGQATKERSAEKLFLGSYVRYHESLSDSTLRQFDQLGPAVTQSNIGVSEENSIYASRIIDLAEQHGCEIAFISLPIFDKNISEAVAEKRAENIVLALGEGGPPVLDLIDVDINKIPAYFENTRSTHQHFTLQGSMAITRLIADWINQEYSTAFVRPGRDGESSWHEMFEAEEGYLSYFPGSDENESVRFLLKKVLAPRMFMDEIVIFEVNNTRRNSLDCFVKINPNLPENKGLQKGQIALTLEVSSEGGPHELRTIGLLYDDLLEQEDVWVFRSMVPDWNIHAVRAANVNE